MNPETRAWESLRLHASAQLRSSFADHVLRITRQSVEAAPSVVSQFALSAATAALCFGAVAFFESRGTDAAADQTTLADWQEIAFATADTAPSP
jgi:hypothetical protein